MFIFARAGSLLCRVCLLVFVGVLGVDGGDLDPRRPYECAGGFSLCRLVFPRAQVHIFYLFFILCPPCSSASGLGRKKKSCSCVLCCFALPCLVLFVLHCLVLVLPCLVLPCLVLSCFVLSCFVLSCLDLSCFTLSCLALLCLVLLCLVLSCFA